jgi:hypothetical protein
VQKAPDQVRPVRDPPGSKSAEEGPKTWLTSAVEFCYSAKKEKLWTAMLITLNCAPKFLRLSGIRAGSKWLKAFLPVNVAYVNSRQ